LESGLPIGPAACLVLLLTSLSLLFFSSETEVMVKENLFS
jgi:hypothetical protein